MITHEFDLDAPSAPALGPSSGSSQAGAGISIRDDAAQARSAGSWWSRSWRAGRTGTSTITLLALVLAGVAIGAVTAAAPAGGPGPAPLTSVLSVLDVSLSGTTPTVQFRLTLTNPGASLLQMTGLVLVDGPRTISFSRTTPVAAHASQVVDIAAHPACTHAGSDEPLMLSGYVQLAGGGRAPLLLDQEADRPGGLCAVLDQALPRGWRAPVTATRAALDGPDLVLDVPALAGRQIAGSDPDANGVVVASAYVGERLAAASVTDQTQLRLIGPAPCLDGTVSDTVPMSIRLLVREDGGVQSVLVQIGPRLAVWVTASCST